MIRNSGAGLRCAFLKPGEGYSPSKEKTKSLARRRSGPVLGPSLQLSCTPSSWISWVSSWSCAPEQKSMSVSGRAGAGGGGPHQGALPQTAEAMRLYGLGPGNHTDDRRPRPAERHLRSPLPEADGVPQAGAPTGLQVKGCEFSLENQQIKTSSVLALSPILVPAPRPGAPNSPLLRHVTAPPASRSTSPDLFFGKGLRSAAPLRGNCRSWGENG